MRTRRPIWLAGCLALLISADPQGAPEQLSTPASTRAPAASSRALVTAYCIRCHNERLKTASLALDTIATENIEANAEVWEKVWRKLRARAMPPAGSPRPDETGYHDIVSDLESELDRVAKVRPNPGRTDTFRRLNRTEYQNAIRDLLGLDVDVTELLPSDDASYGFDNVSVATLSPTLMERYLAAAQKISRLAVGSPVRVPGSRVVILPPDLTQEDHVEGLPFGTRGGAEFTHTFPVDGEYEIQVRLSRNRNENVEGLTEPHQMEILLDGERLRIFTIAPSRNRLGQYYADEAADKGLEVRLPVKAGPHFVAVTFLRKNSALIETERQPYQAHFNQDRHPRVQPGVYSVAIVGPFQSAGAGETPSRRRIFVCRPSNAAEEPACARTIVSRFARQAYRRPVTDRDLEVPLGFYKQARAEGGFEVGIEMALRAMLASTEFLFRIERDPEGAAADAPYRISDIELASRLSFFLWSSLPDDELGDLAARGALRQPAVLERQVRRMLADPRSDALVTNFAGQWLHLRNLAAASPDARLYPDFDDNLRQAFRRETELLFKNIVTEDRSVVELLDANYTFLNERLARHYGIPNVYGDHFRRVTLGTDNARAGLLGHGSVLTVTSYANRTSPVRRGKWILENLVGMPPPPPPGNVPPLQDNAAGAKALTMRERMVQHRANPTCAACHQLMDPAGLSMENFDPIGRWRTRGEGGSAIDVSGSLPGGQTFDGVAGLRQALVARPELFVGTLTEKLLTYALGRGVEWYDAPAVRQIVRDAAKSDNHFSAIVVGIAKSVPFQMRRAQ